MIVKLFVRFRPLCLRYLQRAPHLGANERIWRVFENADNQPFEFYWHLMGPENGAETAQMDLQKGHSCSATVALSAFKCGSFASSESPNEQIGGLFRQFKAGFPFWLEFFGGGVFVDILHRHPTSCEDAFHWFLCFVILDILRFGAKKTAENVIPLRHQVRASRRSPFTSMLPYNLF